MQMGELAENEIKLWKQMLFLWERMNVPSVKTKDFVVGKHLTRSPWFSILEKEQIPSDTKSLDRTAKHLVVDLSGEDRELVAAYKMYSFIKSYYRLQQPFTRVLILVMEKHSVYEGNLWFASAKNVLPYVNNDPYQFEQEILNKDWISVVISAAETWIKIAQEWKILIIPEYPGKESELNKKLKRFSTLLDSNEHFKRFINLRYELGKTLEKDDLHFLSYNVERENNIENLSLISYLSLPLT